VPNEILTPRETWPDKGAYDETAGKLVQMFTKNFGKFEEYVTPEVVASAPKKAA
jgi:phosphoenolpyruvate carboxykinase (ATP)